MRSITKHIAAIGVILVLNGAIFLGSQNLAYDITEIGFISSALDTEIQNEMINGTIPSLQAGIVLQNRLIWAKDFGSQPSLDTIYTVGSITKAFTATAFLQLHEQGQIDLDADVSTYLPYTIRNPTYPNTPITIRQLLSHRAGMIRDAGALQWYDNSLLTWLNDTLGIDLPLWVDPPPILDEWINSTSTANPEMWTSEPGTQYEYSNVGFLFLAYLMEQITGQSYAAYIQENIITPLGLTNTGFEASSFPNQLAIPHEPVGGSLLEVPIYDNYYYGAGGLRSTVPDLAQYLIAHMNQGRSNGVQLLQPESVELMHTVVSSSYGLGWHHSEIGQGHGGVTVGFTAEMRYQENRLGAYGIVLLIGRAANFEDDPDFMLSKATIIQLLLQEAGLMFAQSFAFAGQVPLLITLGGLSVGIVVITVFLVVRWRKGTIVNQQ
jgi:CubicO group peptidase (beta-lactamase class C family)